MALTARGTTTTTKEVNLASGSQKAKSTKRREEGKNSSSDLQRCCAAGASRASRQAGSAPLLTLIAQMLREAPGNGRDVDLAVPHCGLFNIVYLKPF